MPLKLGLELMAITRTDSLNSERELLYDVMNKISRAGLIVLLIDFKYFDTCAVVNSDILEAFNALPIFTFEE